MSIFRSNLVLDSYETRPAVHSIPSNTIALAFGDAASIGAKTSGILSFEKLEIHNRPLR